MRELTIEEHVIRAVESYLWDDGERGHDDLCFVETRNAVSPHMNYDDDYCARINLQFILASLDPQPIISRAARKLLLHGVSIGVKKAALESLCQ
jgi:hypothetical protein